MDRKHHRCEMPVIYNLTYRFNKTDQNPSKIIFFSKIDKQILKFLRKCEGPREAKIILMKNKTGRLTDIKIYYKTKLICDLMLAHK